MTEKVIKILPIAITVVILSGAAIMAFNYFKVQKAPESSPQATPSELTMIFSCPTDKSSCTPVEFQNQGHSALGFDLPPQSTVKRVIPSISRKSFSGPNENSPVGIYESFVFGNDCFVLTYTFPADAQIQAPSSSLLRFEPVAKLGTKGLSAEGKKVNLILELQKRSVDTAEQCSDLSKESEDFGDYQILDAGLFN